MTRAAPVSLSFTVPTEIYNIGKAFEGLMLQFRACQGRGLTTMQELTTVLSAEVVDLLTALQGVSEIGPEFKEDAFLASKALLIPIMDGLDGLLKK